MPLPYENATSGNKALDDLSKILTEFGCTTFGTMTDTEKGEVMVQFKYRQRQVMVVGSYRGYAAAWLKHHPYTSRTRGLKVDHEKKAMAQAKVSICSVLRDWIKGQVTAVEVGMMTFDGAFLGQILLPSGRTVLQECEQTGFLRLTNESAE
jgi:4-hydroxyphenylpyruvate dioxygenase-like putative hemolysin